VNVSYVVSHEWQDHAIAQAVSSSHRSDLGPIRGQVTWALWWTNGIGVGFHQVFRFPLSFLLLPTAVPSLIIPPPDTVLYSY
jgi:hypothetical protein